MEILTATPTQRLDLTRFDDDGNDDDDGNRSEIAEEAWAAAQQPFDHDAYKEAAQRAWQRAFAAASHWSLPQPPPPPPRPLDVGRSSRRNPDSEIMDDMRKMQDRDGGIAVTHRLRRNRRYAAGDEIDEATFSRMVDDWDFRTVDTGSVKDRNRFPNADTRQATAQSLKEAHERLMRQYEQIGERMLDERSNASMTTTMMNIDDDQTATTTNDCQLCVWPLDGPPVELGCCKQKICTRCIRMLRATKGHRICPYCRAPLSRK
jgi:hypothetical protein